MRNLKLNLIFITACILFSYNNNIQATPTNYTTSNYFTPLSTAFDFKILPNPAQDFIKVNFKSNVSALLFIHDGLGNEVLSEVINNESDKEISLQNLSSGIYFVSIKINNETSIKRLVKY